MGEQPSYGAMTTDERRALVIDDPRSDTFHVVARTRMQTTYPNGWAVLVTLVHAGDDEPNPDKVVAADVIVAPVNAERVRDLGGVACVMVGDADDGSRYGVPLVNLWPVTAEHEHATPDDVSASTFHTDPEQAESYATDLVATLKRRGLDVSGPWHDGRDYCRECWSEMEPSADSRCETCRTPAVAVLVIDSDGVQRGTLTSDERGDLVRLDGADDPVQP